MEMELFANVEDITDPSLLEKILIRMEEINEEDEEFMQILLSKRDLMVITWEQPWYQKCNSLTRCFIQSNENEVETFRTGSICQAETEIIHKNWKKFRKIYDVPNKPICLARWKNKDKSRSPSTPEETVRRFVISFLAFGLERTLHQVYKHFATHYGSPNKGQYSNYEETVIAVCLYHSPKNAVAYLSAILSREPRGLYKRIWQIRNGKPEPKRLKWNLQLATKFLNLLREYTGEESIENLKLKRFDKSIWLKLEKEMDQHYIYLQRFWHNKLHVQLFIKCDVKINNLRRKILKSLSFYPYKVWNDIRWKEIAKHFPDAFNHIFLYNTCRRVIYTNLKEYRKMPLDDVIDFAIQKTKSAPNRRIRNLVLNENQELEIIRYTNKIKFDF